MLRLLFRRCKISQYLELFPNIVPKSNDDDTIALKEYVIANIEKILERKNRRYLNVFHLGSGTNLTDTIFRAVFHSKYDKQGYRGELRNNQIHSLYFIKILDLSVPHDLLKLAVSWNYLEGAHEIFEYTTMVNNLLFFLVL